MKHRRAGGGFTLIELMLVVTIIGILATVGPNLMLQVQNFYLVTTARAEIQRDARASLDTINGFLRQGTYQSIEIDTASGQGPYSQIQFKHVDGRQFEFRQSGSKLIMTVDGNQTEIAKNLVYVAFTFPRSDYPRLVSVSMTMGKAIQKGQRKELELTIQKVRVMN